LLDGCRLLFGVAGIGGSCEGVRGGDDDVKDSAKEWGDPEDDVDAERDE
jgi:hypothetical protein